MGRDDYRYDDDKPRRRRGGDEDYREHPPRRPRSRFVTSLVVLNFVIGPLVVLFGACGGLCTATIPSMLPLLLGVPDGVGNTTVASVMSMVVVFLWGVATIIMAIGLLYRTKWSRVIGLFLGGCAMSVGLLYLTLTMLFLFGSPPTSDHRALFAVTSAAKTAFFLGYGNWTYVVLLHPRRVQEFH